MNRPKSLILFHFILISFTLAVTLFIVPRSHTTSRLLPNVSLKMEDPQFWIGKIENPGRLLLVPEEIQKMNEENLKKEDLLLSRVKDLKEGFTREEILSLLKDDWENFGYTGEVRYGKNGNPLGETFWDRLKNNLNQESLREKNRILFGLISKRTDIRVFPTEELSMSSPENCEFDRFQLSSISPGSPIAIYHFSKDRLWAYVQTPFIRGWVGTADLAMARDKSEIVNYEETKDRLVTTGDFIPVFGDPLLQQPVFLAQMGDSFPILDQSGSSGMAGQYYVIRIPFREIDGQLTFRKGYIPWNEDVHRGFLPYTQKNMAYQAFKMLHQPYGWGEMSGGRDCSRFMMDLFSTFGILIPRNSKLQARVGISLGQLEGKTIKEKKKILDRAIPLATTLRLPGHIMLYLGRENGKYYVIHNTWGIQKAGWFGPSVKKIGKTVVSDLSLGKSGPEASLLDRTTDIRTLGPSSGPSKRINE